MLTDEEKELIDLSLSLRRNYIETGDILCGAVDLVRQGKQSKLRVLSLDQMQLILDIEALRKKIRTL